MLTKRSFAIHFSSVFTRFVFFSSIRRHTRCLSDWSSDVCSSDLPRVAVPGAAGFRFYGAVEWCNAFLFPMSREQFVADLTRLDPGIQTYIANPGDVFEVRSEERRVGKEGRTGWSAYQGARAAQL